MKKTILTFIAAVIPLILEAQVGIDRLYFDMRGSFHQEVTDGNYESQFKGDYLNLNIFGHIGEKIDYRVRQQFSRRFSRKTTCSTAPTSCISTGRLPEGGISFSANMPSS